MSDPPRYTFRVTMITKINQTKKRSMSMKNTNEQLELTMQPKTCPSAARRTRRVSTARRWFARMRQIVDSAPDWPVLPRRNHAEAGRPLQPPLIPARTVDLNGPAAQQQLVE